MKKKVNKDNQNIKKKINVGKIDDDFIMNMSMNQKRQQEKILRERAIIRAEKKRSARKIAILMLSSFVTLVVVVVMCIFGLTSPNFNIKSISIVDNVKVLEEDILELSKIEEGMNIFKVVSFRTEDKIRENPYIENVNVQKKYPRDIVITISERTPVYAVEVEDGYIYIDENGYLLEAVEKNEEEILILSGVELGADYKLGEKINTKYLESLHFFKSVFAIAEEEHIVDNITGIDIGDSNNYHIVMDKVDTDIYFGDSRKL